MSYGSNKRYDFVDKVADYAQLAAELKGLLDGERDLVANAANMSALVYETVPGLNWVGVYLLKQGELVVGPFQGRPACVRIALGAGVCGTAAARQTTIVVPDVHEFPGHIACDAASRSEIVIPLLSNGTLIGVFDVDSPQVDRFDAADRQGLEQLVSILLATQS